MYKYLEVSKTYMKTQLAWRADVLFHMMFAVMKILFAFLLWGMVFREREMIRQFSFHGMMSYYIVSSFLSQIEMSDGVSREIHERIRNGTFSKYMILPINMELYFIFMEMGVIAFYGIFNLIAAVIWKYFFHIRFVLTDRILIVGAAAIMIVLGLLFMVQLNYLLGILTLKYQGIGTFLMIKNNLMELVTGSIVPLVLFPEIAVKIMQFLPFYYVTNLPSMLLTGQCTEEAGKGVVIIGFWCLVTQGSTRWIWKKYSRKYDGVGI